MVLAGSVGLCLAVALPAAVAQRLSDVMRVFEKG